MKLVDRETYISDASQQEGSTMIILFGDNSSEDVTKFLRLHGITDLSNIGAVIVSDGDVVSIEKNVVSNGYSYTIEQSTIKITCSDKYYFDVNGYEWYDDISGNNAVLVLNKTGNISDYVLLSQGNERVVR